MKKTLIPFEIRFAYREEWQDIITLVWRTFLEFEAGDYSKEGIRNFNDFITDQTLFKMFCKGEYQVLTAVEGGVIVGIVSVRDASHISLLFVDKKHHGRGIGTALIERLHAYLYEEEGMTRVTVNSSPYAVGFYHKLGFSDLDKEQTADGIRYTPMEFYI